MGRAKRNRRQRGATGGLPGWAMLTIGLIIGLFVAFLVYLDDLDQPPNATARAPAADDAASEAGDAPADDGDQGPRFEFYSILPELEVVVPELGQEPADAGAGGGETSAGEESGGEPGVDTDGRRYFLQAGSFRKADKADRLKAEIALLGLDVAIQTVRVNGDRWHRVRVGPFSRSGGLQAAQQRLRNNEIDYLVMRERSSDG